MSTPLSKTVFKAFEMLKSFHAADEWLTCKELSSRTELPQASCYRLVQTLEEIGALVRVRRGVYRPGMLLVSLSKNVGVQELVRDASLPIVSDLANKVNATIHVGIYDAGMVTYVRKATTPKSIITHTKAGAQLEAYCSALGKVLLAEIPFEQLESDVLDTGLIALTPHTITEPALLRRQLEDIGRLGFAIDDRESRVDTACVAVPIRDRQGRTVAALSAADSAENMTPGRRAELCRGLMEAAAALSLKVYPTSPAERALPVSAYKHSANERTEEVKVRALH